MTDTTILLEQFLPSTEDDDIVCHCVLVRGGTIRADLQQGVTTVTGLQETTGCGSVCGGCVPEIAEILGTEEWETPAVAPEITREEREAFKRYVLVTPQPASKPLSRILRRLGKLLH